MTTLRRFMHLLLVTAMLGFLPIVAGYNVFLFSLRENLMQAILNGVGAWILVVIFMCWLVIKVIDFVEN